MTRADGDMKPGAHVAPCRGTRQAVAARSAHRVYQIAGLAERRSTTRATPLKRLPAVSASRAEVVEVALPGEFDGSLRLQQIVQFSDIAKNYGPIADANPDRVSAKLKEIIAEGRTFSKADYAAARAEADPLYDSLLQC